MSNESEADKNFLLSSAWENEKFEEELKEESTNYWAANFVRLGEELFRIDEISEIFWRLDRFPES